MNRSAVKTNIITFLGLIFLVGCAMQQDVVTLDDRLAAIEQRNAENAQRLDEHKKFQAQNEQDLRERYAGQNALIRSLRDEIRLLNGRLEENEYLLKHKLIPFEASKDKQANQLDKIEQIVSSNKDRIRHIEQYLNLEITEPDLRAKQESGAISAIQPEKKLSESEIYQAAKQTFDQGNFEAAREQFQQLVKQYPKTKYADNAQFWVGETYYRAKWYEKAILEYQKVIEKYPKGNKVQASFLKQGLAFLNLGDKANARLILTELVKKFPKSNEAQIAKQKLKGL
ncbi:tol-pal system protein YbgF [Thermodesulfobacteriota bacterium]